MTQETPSNTGAESFAFEQQAAPAPARKAPAAPAWLPFAALAIVPAVIVGLAVYFLAGSSSSSDSAPGIIDGFFRLGPSSDDNIESFAGQPPPDFPSEFPLFKGAKPVAAFVVNPEASTTGQTQSRGRSYFVIYNTDASADEVYKFYLSALESDPWQVEVARASDEFTGVQFSRPDDPDVQGDVSIHRSELDKRTAIYVSFQDLTPDQSSASASKTFVLPSGRPLPEGFPTDIELYKSKKGSSVITDTYFQRDPGSTSYVITFLTQDESNEVVDSYKADFEKRGWTVTNSATGNTGLAFSIDFTDGPRQQIQGTVRADDFADDKSYTKVDVLLQVTSGRPRGN